MQRQAPEDFGHFSSRSFVIWCFALSTRSTRKPTGASSLSFSHLVFAAFDRLESRSSERRSCPLSLRDPVRRGSGEGERLRVVRRRTGELDDEGDRRRGERRDVTGPYSILYVGIVMRSKSQEIYKTLLTSCLLSRMRCRETHLAHAYHDVEFRAFPFCAFSKPYVWRCPTTTLPVPMTHELELTITVGRCVGRAACAVQVGTDRGWTSWDPSNILTPLTLGSNHINVQPLVLLVLRSPCRLTGEGEANCSQLSAHQPQTMRPQLKQSHAPPARLQLG